MTPTKILSLFLCFCLILEQSVFAQTIDLSHYFARNSASAVTQSDKFRPLHLRYISYDNQANDFKILLDKGDFFNQRTEEPKNRRTLELLNSLTPKLEEATQELMKYFFIGLSLPNEKFWVNLRPDSPDNILDPDLEKTDIGRIFLEADLQLKKDTASFTSPQTPEGKAYWDKLYQKAGELFGTENITIPTLTRPWIVPDEVILRESPEGAYIYKATLKVMLEEDYIRSQVAGHKSQVNLQEYSFKDPRLKELNEYSTQLIKESIIPKLTKEINSTRRYAPLRQVYYSLILAQWFKEKYGSLGSPRVSGTRAPVNNYIDLIDSGNLANLTSSQPYDKQGYFQQYQKSFKDGEYNLQEPVYTPMSQSIRRYVSGGMMLNISNSSLTKIETKALPPPNYPFALLPVKVEGDQFYIINSDVANSPIENITHPFLGEILWDPSGEFWDQHAIDPQYVYGPNLLSGFNPKDIIKNPKKPLSELIKSAEPLNEKIKKAFYNMEAIVDTEVVAAEPIPLNLNPDLGLQRQLRRMIEKGIIGSDTFLILSHGHFMAGLVALAQAMDRDFGTYLFDTTVYIPRGGWKANTNNSQLMLKYQFQIWSEELEKAKKEHQVNNRKWAGGIAIALFGHRGRLDLDTYKSAYIDPRSLFGEIDDFMVYLKDNRFKKVVIITEESVNNPDLDNVLPLDSLKNGVYGLENEDLYEYMRQLNDRGLKVQVVSGDIRPVVKQGQTYSSGNDFEEYSPYPGVFSHKTQIYKYENKSLEVEKLTSGNILLSIHDKGIRYIFNLDAGEINTFRDGSPISADIRGFANSILEAFRNKKFSPQILKKIEVHINMLEDIVSSASSAVAADTKASASLLDKKGGIDLSRINKSMRTESVSSPGAGGLSSPVDMDFDVNEELIQLQKLLNAQIIPSADRLNRYARVACSSSLSSPESKDSALSLIAETFRLQEEKAVTAPAELKALAAWLEQTG